MIPNGGSFGDIRRIQTYLSEYEDDGFYGHVSLGRSFALEMGTVVPTTDQRLGDISLI